MTARTKRTAKSSGSSVVREQAIVEFKRNVLLPALAGAHSRHFARLEQQLGVKIATRGNLVSVEGPRAAREQALDVLRALYQRLSSGEEIGPSEVDTEVRFAQAGTHDSAVPGASPIKTASGKTVRARGPAQSAYLELMRENDLVLGIGPAGTGKTYLAAAMGAHLFYARRVERLVLSRPALEAGERLGFLPGDLKEKVDPYLRPLYDALFEVMGPQCLKLMESGLIEVAPLAFMRGRTLSRSFVILDEAQNCTPSQMKMALTRLGEDSQMVVTGDLTQSDLPGGPQGLEEAIFLLSNVEGVGMARFTQADVVRHPLVTHIVAAYDAKRTKPSKES